ncbi:MAG TPA: leucyl/phenylalanyl-tRNA--protein transferase [Gammaproteobacteria bacterium]|nr:leucyl/phenylalanyl-tRNA--protein transferase [Gammaproteobacteria bacterium]
MAQEMRWLGPPGSEIRFPDPASALSWPNGLLAAGGDLSPERLLAAYRRGIFPWYETGQPILWWCPDPRAVIIPGELHIARRLRRQLASRPFEASFDREFAAVVRGCARSESPGTGTWITPEMAAAYTRLHQLGHAHSVEVWAGDALAGGLYGVAIGRAFFAESMFSGLPNASKAAMIHLTRELRARDFLVMDCQLPSRHLATMGAREIPRREFLALVSQGLAGASREASRWSAERRVVLA